MATITVVITTYNRKYELRRALDSVYAQTDMPDEIITIDGGSDDGTREYIQKQYYSGLNYIEDRKLGGSLNELRNAGLAKASSDYVTFLDAPNIWLPEKIQRVREHLNESDVISTDYLYYEKYCPQRRPDGDNEMGMMHWQFLDADATVYRTDLIKGIGGFNSTDCYAKEELAQGLIKKEGDIRVYHISEVLSKHYAIYNGEQDCECMDAKQNNGGVSAGEKELRLALERKESFYTLMTKWVSSKIKGINVADKLVQMDIFSVAIYGAGRHGKLLYEELKEREFEVVCFIDKNSKTFSKDEPVPIVGIEDEFPNMDAVIVSPYLEYDSISKLLVSKKVKRILSLFDIV